MDYFLIILLATAITIAVIEDLRRQKIPNLVTLPTIFLAGTYHTFSFGIDGFMFSASGFAIGLGLFLLPYALGGMGAGDVKLMGALGAIVGAKGILITSVLVIIAGGVYGLILFVLHPRYTAELFRRLWATLTNFVLTRHFILFRPGTEKMPVLRYAVPIAIGAGGYMFIKYTGYDLFPELLGEKFQIFSIAMS